MKHVLVLADRVQLLDAVDAVGDFLHNLTARSWRVEALPDFRLSGRDPKVSRGGLLVGPLENLLEIFVRQTHLPLPPVLVDESPVYIDP